MSIKRLERHEWKSYFDRLAHGLAGRQADIEVDALAVGSQRVTAWAPLLGLVYDPGEDLLAVMVEGLDHMIRHPHTVHIDTAGGPDGVPVSLQVVDAGQARHIVRLRPAPDAR